MLVLVIENGKVEDEGEMRETNGTNSVVSSQAALALQRYYFCPLNTRLWSARRPTARDSWAEKIEPRIGNSLGSQLVRRYPARLYLLSRWSHKLGSQRTLMTL